ncbi:DEAD/DEAH box helicase family protein [Vibrio alginolyticus]|nr:DEAD/DEAH box helicase family protein [Vibrio alginolyticus]
MKLKFNPNLDYQQQAIQSTLTLFDGLSSDGDTYVEHGIANTLDLNPEKMLANLHKVQEQNFIEKSASLLDDNDVYPFPNFSVEMETGTGKTYVYLRTIFELNKNLGLRKFIIVVPSVAIREGVLASLASMREHFLGLYNRVPFEHYVYSSKDLSKVRQYATANTMQIMVINIQAFQRDAGDIENYESLTPEQIKKLSVIHREQDKMSGIRPIQFIQEVRPVVIIDEPQSVDTTAKARRAINHLKPMFALRYSATHKNPYNVLYELGPVKAYDMKLVKQISVASIQADQDINQAYIKLSDIGYAGKAKTPSATVMIFEDSSNGTKEKAVKLKQGTDLSDHTNRQGYEGYVVDEIYAEPGAEYVRFTNNIVLEPEEEKDSIQDEVLKEQIRQTVLAHFNKERVLLKQGLSVKVLSLFFIDKVANYRFYDEQGSRQKGKLALWFEQAYQEISQLPQFAQLPKRSVELVHDGYFAEVKKRGKVVDVKDTSGTTKDDAEVYELIMKNKERLLDENEPLRFVFSHSALKEGWDNPNVFQICSLREFGSEKERRQTLGRGLRLAVDANGERLYNPQVNRLTVIASESFEDYAKNLQTEMEKDIGGGFKFGRVPSIAFASLVGTNDETLGQERSKQLWHELKREGYINSKGDIEPKFNPDDLYFELKLSDEYQPMESEIIDKLRSYMFAGRVQNERKRVPINFNKNIYLNPDFKVLWEKICQRTRYSIQFKTDELIDLAAHKLKTMPIVPPVSLTIGQTQASVTDAGVGADRVIQAPKVHHITSHKQLPDLISALQNRTDLTRSTLLAIIKKGARLGEFKTNPQAFITEAAKEINKSLTELLVDGIRYQKIAGEQYQMEKFDEAELEAYLDKAYHVQHADKGEYTQTPYDYIQYDSDIELKTANALDGAENVKFFCKLPKWFTIPTPVGEYNPDWAVVLEDDKKVYLIRETKTTHDSDKRRMEENLKILCGAAHFKALENVDYAVATSVAEVLTHTDKLKPI